METKRWADLVLAPGGGAWARVPQDEPRSCPYPRLPPLRCSNAALRRSHDGGRTWQTEVVNWRNLRVASFPTRSVGFAFAGERLLRTNDGGRSCRVVHVWRA